MSVKEEIAKVAKKVVAEDDNVQGLLVFDRQGLVVYSSLKKKRHSALFGALTRDISEEISILGEEMGIGEIKTLHVTLSNYIFHIFQVNSMYVLLLKFKS